MDVHNKDTVSVFSIHNKDTVSVCLRCCCISVVHSQLNWSIIQILLCQYIFCVNDVFFFSLLIYCILQIFWLFLCFCVFTLVAQLCNTNCVNMYRGILNHMKSVFIFFIFTLIIPIYSWRCRIYSFIYMSILVTLIN